jgi:hypothetical protein
MIDGVHDDTCLAHRIGQPQRRASAVRSYFDDRRAGHARTCRESRRVQRVAFVGGHEPFRSQSQLAQCSIHRLARDFCLHDLTR